METIISVHEGELILLNSNGEKVLSQIYTNRQHRASILKEWNNRYKPRFSVEKNVKDIPKEYPVKQIIRANIEDLEMHELDKSNFKGGKKNKKKEQFLKSAHRPPKSQRRYINY